MKNNAVNELTLKLKEELNNSSLIKEYKRLKQLIENDPEINELAFKLKVSAKKSDNKQEFLSLKKAYEEHPLIVNFKQVEQEVNDMLSMLKEIIEK